MPEQGASVEWRDGKTPISVRFSDPYFSLGDGLAETGHVFLAGNDLPQRFGQGFRIAELGFGTGLNMLAAWKSWRDAGIDGVLTYTSFEAFPMSVPQMDRALRAFPQLAELRDMMLDALQKNPTMINVDQLSARIVVGDARQRLAEWDGVADAWFLDGFSPARNPEMWEAGLLKQVARHTAPCGTFATYTAAGAVRRALESAGFTVTRKPGHGRKRHMSVGKLETCP